MDLLPGPVEDAAVTGARPFLDAHFGIEHWAERLRTGAPLPTTLFADASAAGLFTATAVTADALVAVELGQSLAPVEFLAALIARVSTPAAMAAPRAGGGYARFGPLDADVTVVWTDNEIGIANRGVIGEEVECIDPMTPMAFVDIAAPLAVSDDVERRAMLLVAAVHAGLARGARDMAVEYARTRVQFDRPVGANQAIKHLCADAATRAEAAWASLLYASVSLAEGRADARFQVAVASRVASGAANRNARTNIQVHGGRGYTFECPAHLFLVRAQILDQVTGGVRRARRALLDHGPLV